MLQPDEVQAVAAYVAENRPGNDPFDIAINGDVSGDHDPSGTIARFEQAGATWWLELCADTPRESEIASAARPAALRGVRVIHEESGSVRRRQIHIERAERRPPLGTHLLTTCAVWPSQFDDSRRGGRA